MLPWGIYCLKYGKGEEGENIVRALIKNGEVFCKEIDGSIFAGHREVSSSWKSGCNVNTGMNQAGSSIIVFLILLVFLMCLYLQSIYY